MSHHHTYIHEGVAKLIASLCVCEYAYIYVCICEYVYMHVYMQGERKKEGEKEGGREGGREGEMERWSQAPFVGRGAWIGFYLYLNCVFAIF